jgi:hypothetical protein
MVGFGRRAGVSIGPNLDKEDGRRLICVAATMREKAFPQNFRFPLQRACAVVCDDIVRFGERMCVDRDFEVPPLGALRGLGEVLTLRQIFIVSKVQFPGPYAGPPAPVRALVGQGGLFVQEDSEEVATNDTTFDCFVLLNDRDEARIYDYFRDYLFGRPPIFVFGFPAAKFTLPRKRALPMEKSLDDPFQCFIPTDELILRVY